MDKKRRPTETEAAPEAALRTADISQKRRLDQQLDEALKETFPASDAAAVGQESKEADRPVHRQTPVIDLDNVRRLARKVKG